MNQERFAALQDQIGWTNEQCAIALGVKPYVIAGYREPRSNFKITGATMLAMRMLADMPAEQRKQYLGSE